MRRVAVITAPNMAYKNPGMVTVDLAFEAVCRRLGPDVATSWYTLHPPELRPLRDYVRSRDLPFDFAPLGAHLAELQEHDAIVFWGDFQHARHYLQQDATTRMLDLGPAADRRSAQQLVTQSLLLAGTPEHVLDRTVLYGGSILHNSQSDYADEEYASPFRRLMSRCHAVWMRDPLSAAKAAHLRRGGAAHFGADCALLLRPGDLDFLPTTGWADAVEEGVGAVFLGARTPVPRWLPALSRELAHRLGVRLEWLPWLGASRELGTPWIRQRGDDYSLGDLLAALSRYQIVITDTYHLCVNAWRMGVPTVCIGSPTRRSPEYQTLDDLKKYVFYSSYEAEDFYLSTDPESVAQRMASLDRLLDLTAGDGARRIAIRMRQHAEQSLEALQDELTTVLA